MKSALKKVYNDETSLRQMIRSRKKAALHAPRPSMEQVQRFAFGWLFLLAGCSCWVLAAWL